MMDNVSTLKILYWNACSLLKKIHELYRFLEDNQVDVCCVSETCLSPNCNVPSHSDFILYRLDRVITHNNRRSGGVAIIIRRELNHSLCRKPPTKIAEVLGIHLNTNRGTLEIFSLYLPGGTADEHIRSHFAHDIRILTSRTNPYVICGDFNSKHRSWNCSQSNTAGTFLFNKQQEGDYFIFHPPTPTHYAFAANTLPSTIDLVVTNGQFPISDLEAIDSASDHQLVIFSIELCQPPDRTPPKAIPAYHLADWVQFKSIINQGLNSYHENLTIEHVLPCEAEIDETIKTVTDTILKAKCEAVPLKQPSKYSVHLPAEIINKIRRRNFLRRQAKRYPALHSDLRREINSLQGEISREIKALTNSNRKTYHRPALRH